jgi:hypothetical protein
MAAIEVRAASGCDRRRPRARSRATRHAGGAAGRAPRLRGGRRSWRTEPRRLGLLLARQGAAGRWHGRRPHGGELLEGGDDAREAAEQHRLQQGPLPAPARWQVARAGGLGCRGKSRPVGAPRPRHRRSPAPRSATGRPGCNRVLPREGRRCACAEVTLPAAAVERLVRRPTGLSSSMRASWVAARTLLVSGPR